MCTSCSCSSYCRACISMGTLLLQSMTACHSTVQLMAQHASAEACSACCQHACPRPLPGNVQDSLVKLWLSGRAPASFLCAQQEFANDECLASTVSTTTATCSCLGASTSALICLHSSPVCACNGVVLSQVGPLCAEQHAALHPLL